mmetsp:Transcript_46776/g.104809  ORF Transcript_46776/g.104809 Transcript_46776/m.104809 type:complete len:374 (+) Transcript_46776:206-1327(+)
MEMPIVSSSAENRTLPAPAVATSFSKSILCSWSPLRKLTSTFELACMTFTLILLVEPSGVDTTPSHFPGTPPVFTYMLPAADIRFLNDVLKPARWMAEASVAFETATGSGHGVHPFFISSTMSAWTPMLSYSSSRNSSVHGCTDTASTSQSGGVGSSGMSKVTFETLGCNLSSHAFTLSSSTVQGSSSHFHASHKQLTLIAASYSSSLVACSSSMAVFLSLKRPTASVQHLSKFLQVASSSDFHAQNDSSKSSCKLSHLSLWPVWLSVRSSHSSQVSSNSFQRPQKCSFINFKYFNISSSDMSMPSSKSSSGACTPIWAFSSSSQDSSASFLWASSSLRHSLWRSLSPSVLFSSNSTASRASSTCVAHSATAP